MTRIEELKEKRHKIVREFWDLTRHWTYEEAEGEKEEMDLKLKDIDMEIWIEEKSSPKYEQE